MPAIDDGVGLAGGARHDVELFWVDLRADRAAATRRRAASRSASTA
jgi:hypothetical protein